MNQFKITRYVLSCALVFFSMVVNAAEPGMTFSPLTPTVVSVSDGDLAIVRYNVTNVTSFNRNFHMKDHLTSTPWLTQLTGPGACVLDANLNFWLNRGASCVLALRINGTKVPSGGVTGGPAVCYGINDTNTTCFQPAVTTNLLTIIKNSTTTARTPRAFIANTGASDIQQCTLTSNGSIGACVAKVVSGLIPSGIAINSTNNFVYVTDRTNNSVFRCTMSSTNTLLNCTSTGSNFTSPSAIALDSGRAYVTNSSNGTVTVCNINPLFKTLENCTQSIALMLEPRGIAINPTGTIVYITGDPNLVEACRLGASGEINDANCQPAWPINTVFDEPYGITLNKAGTIAYVTNFNNGTVATCSINSTTGLFSSCVQSDDFVGNPKGIAINSDGRFAYIVSSQIGGRIVKCPINNNGSFSINCTFLPEPPASSPFNSADGIALLGVVI